MFSPHVHVKLWYLATQEICYKYYGKKRVDEWLQVVLIYAASGERRCGDEEIKH